MLDNISYHNVISTDKTDKENSKTEYLELVDYCLGMSDLVRRVLFLFCSKCFDLSLRVLTLIY